MAKTMNPLAGPMKHVAAPQGANPGPKGPVLTAPTYVDREATIHRPSSGTLVSPKLTNDRPGKMVAKPMKKGK